MFQIELTSPAGGREEFAGAELGPRAEAPRTTTLCGMRLRRSPHVSPYPTVYREGVNMTRYRFSALSTAAFVGGSTLFACLGPETSGERLSVVRFETNEALDVAPPPSLEAEPRVEIDPLAIQARLEGQLGDVTLDHETTRNSGFIRMGSGTSVLELTVAAQGDGGAGMLLLHLTGGSEHPVFRTGYWSSELEQAAATEEPPGELRRRPSVVSCAGASLDTLPVEQVAGSFEMTTESHPEEPGVVVLTVRSSYASTGVQASRLRATIRLIDWAPEFG